MDVEVASTLNSSIQVSKCLLEVRPAISIAAFKDEVLAVVVNTNEVKKAVTFRGGVLAECPRHCMTRSCATSQRHSGRYPSIL